MFLVDVDDEDGRKTVYTPDATFKARALVLATGAMGRPPGFKGEGEFLGKGVSYCATCDGAFYRDSEVDTNLNHTHRSNEIRRVNQQQKEDDDARAVPARAVPARAVPRLRGRGRRLARRGRSTARAPSFLARGSNERGAPTRSTETRTRDDDDDERGTPRYESLPIRVAPFVHARAPPLCTRVPTPRPEPGAVGNAITTHSQSTVGRGAHSRAPPASHLRRHDQGGVGGVNLISFPLLAVDRPTTRARPLSRVVASSSRRARRSPSTA